MAAYNYLDFSFRFPWGTLKLADCGVRVLDRRRAADLEGQRSATGVVRVFFHTRECPQPPARPGIQLAPTTVRLASYTPFLDESDSPRSAWPASNPFHLSGVSFQRLLECLRTSHRSTFIERSPK
jgi:hypothetical protein